MHIAPNRKAIVTGGASGIGFEVASQLADAGADVALLDLDRAQPEKAANMLGRGTIAMCADVRSPDQVKRAVERMTDQLGGLDTLVISAGVIHVKPLVQVTEEDWDSVLDVNLKGAFLCSQAAAPALGASRRGRIVTIGSDAGRRGCALLQAYCASKFGLIGLTESLAAEMAPHVTVNCVCPVGVPSTGMGQQMLAWKMSHTGKSSEHVLAGIARVLPLGRTSTVAEVAQTVLFFISDAASFLTGVSLDVDGGAHLNVIPGSNA